MNNERKKGNSTTESYQVVFDSDYPTIENRLKALTQINVAKALSSSYVKNGAGIFGDSNFSDYFNRTGSLKVEFLELLGPSKSFFTEVDGRYFKDSKYKRRFILRGPRYVAALDESLSVPQKLRVFIEDIQSGIEVVRERKFKRELQYLEVAPVLDYIKNALITLYNAYTHRERLGHLQLRIAHYQNLKGELLAAVNESVISFYLALVNDLSEDNVRSLLKAFDNNVLKDIHDAISQEFKLFLFSSKTVVRPESCHPLILAAFAHNISERFPQTKCIYGLPSGGTELACLIHKYLEVKKGIKTQLVLLPISIHSAKNDFNLKSRKFTKEYKALIPQPKTEGTVLHSLLVDDNSCTGETLKIANSLITRYCRNFTLNIKVAEADTIRTKLKSLDKPGRRFLIANPEIFSEAVGILPISKRVRRKHDLRELIEARNLFNYYFKKKKSDLIGRIKGEVIADAIINKYSFLNEQLNDNNSIQTFKHTYLSNFYAVEVRYNGKTYPSVEHAYIAQKYTSIDLANLTPNQKKDLNQVFKIKGIDMELQDFSPIFTDRTLPAGVIKRISNMLQGFGYKPANWDDVRMEIMINLLIQKFSRPEFLDQLKATKGKYLVEGNDWNDTFWGIIGGKMGKNFLGRIIMSIRDHHLEDTMGLSTERLESLAPLEPRSSIGRLKRLFEFPGKNS